MVEVSDFHQKVLRRASTPDELQIYRAGLEWDLTDPIVIESADDFKSAPRWKDRFTPFHHQITNLITFCRRLPVTLLADDVGLGKTISAGLVISELASRSRISKVLVVCPKILGPQWQFELTTKFDIPAKFVTGRDLITADFEEFGAIITTYNSARLYLEKIPDDRFQMLILDEAHKLRNLYGVEKSPQVAKYFHKALQDRRFRFVLMLTATPIHNRLWDLYSLVDLLTVARGHQNPFGAPGVFARKFIADDRETARRLKTEAIDEFRSIIYGYMSRVRRGDAKLHFPDRMVRRHQVDPTPAELELIKTIAEPIQKLNRLVQISILKALASSPEALNSQLKNMARNGTIPASLSQSVNSIVESMPLTAKLKGLGQLIEHLKQDPDRWRLVVFTALRETQTTIQTFLESHGLKVGIINGDSGERNQETMARFRAAPPQHRVIVSTEAGAEGVNLQVANVLVNFDLPWNPMVVEQRIGRIQRLGSEYANVVVYNLTLRGTFEDYIVGRLMEKLQMASHAIGDIDSLLQGSNEDDAEEDFEERLLELVLAALAGKDKKKAAELEVASIEEAINTLDREKSNIETLLGDSEDCGYVGPRAPTLPMTLRSVPLKDFTLRALQSLGARVAQSPPDLYSVEESGGRHYIRFAETSSANVKSTLFNESSNAFQRLVDRITATALHAVYDLDRDSDQRSGQIIRQWIESFGGTSKKIEIEGVNRRFEGTALVRVRATVLHDSFERLVEVPCSPEQHVYMNGRAALRALEPTITDLAAVGLNFDKVSEAASLDVGIAEFSRFYLERREQEVRSAGDDERKKRKLYEEFTPRFEATVVALEGKVHREISARAQFEIDDGAGYESVITAVPNSGELVNIPPTDHCQRSGRKVPKICLSRCQITGASVLKHLLVKSEISGREILPEHAENCTLSGKRVARDELATSDVSGKNVVVSLLRKSEVSGKRGEPEHFSRCSFTNGEALKSELSPSDVSGRIYRRDQEAVSQFSGKKGHRAEFIQCHETRQLIASAEAEQCEETLKSVRRGVLVVCEATGKRVLPSQCAQCSVTNKVALKRALVVSSISQNLMLENVTIRSLSNRLCSSAEAKVCMWSGQRYHPEDMGVCTLTALPIYSQFLTRDHSRLFPLMELLNDVHHEPDGKDYPILEGALSRALNGSGCKIVSEASSPTSNALAICAEIKVLLSLKTKYVGFVFSPHNREIVGRAAQGKRARSGWISD